MPDRVREGAWLDDPGADRDILALRRLDDLREQGRARRVANEKLAYNELAQVFFQWDGARSEYPNLVLIAVWDQRSQEH